MSERLIVHLAPFLQGGAGRMITTLACAQRRSGRDVVVATSATDEPGFENYREYLDAISRAGIPLIKIDSLFKRDASLNAAARLAIEAAIDRRPCVIHAHAAIPSRIGMAVGAPVIQTMHGWSRNKRADYVTEDLSIMRDVDLVAFPSRASRTELTDIGGIFRRTAIVPNGIDALARRHPLPTALAHLPGLRDRGMKVIMTIGSLTPQKNHAVVIRAMPALPNVIAVLVGEGPETDRLAALATSLGVADRVCLAGYHANASSALSVADVFIQPSLTESFGVSVIEAFRDGVPVIASHIAALTELVRDTKCGWTLDPESSGELATVVGDALNISAAERAALTARAHQLFLDRFTDDRMIAAYAALYAGLLA